MPEFKNVCTQKVHYMYNITGKKKSIGLSEAHNELFSNFPDLQYVYPSQFSSPHPLFLNWCYHLLIFTSITPI